RTRSSGFRLSLESAATRFIGSSQFRFALALLLAGGCRPSGPGRDRATIPIPVLLNIVRRQINRARAWLHRSRPVLVDLLQQRQNRVDLVRGIDVDHEPI